MNRNLLHPFDQRVWVYLMYYFTGLSRTLPFWAAFILTRPLGATIANSFDKPINQGGLAVGDLKASAVLDEEGREGNTEKEASILHLVPKQHLYGHAKHQGVCLSSSDVIRLDS